MTTLVPGLGMDALRVPGLPAKAEAECRFFRNFTGWSLRDALSLSKGYRPSPEVRSNRN